MARFFIDRPVFAWVLAIIVMLAGVLAIRALPIEQYPDIAPPTVLISASYPGASAKAVESAVTQVIEERLTGIDHLRYFHASSADGAMQITLTFEPQADPDVAQVQTQNKVQAAISRLPQEVQALGVTVTKANDNFLLVVGLYDDSGRHSQTDLGDLLVTTFRDAISRVKGVGNVQVFGSQYAMRIWLDPQKLYSFNLTPLDIQAAVRTQNTDVSAGQLGALPAVEGQAINATVTAQSRLQSVEDFEHIILRVNTDGSQVRLSDVAKVEIGAEDYSTIARYKGYPAAGMAVSLAAGANALETAALVKARIQTLAAYLPEGVKLVYPYDTTPFIQVSIESVVQTLIEAIFLVFIVMLVFLQNLRATLIPTIAIPVVLLGTFAILSAFGFSINVLTMFAMVLAIGLLVDDAIVVVENVERIMSEEGLSPLEATRKSMGQITGALIGIAAVLSAVFVPMAFFGGSTGAIYRQFSITIVAAMGLSVLVAIILSPSLCATLLKSHRDAHEKKNRGVLGVFNRGFERARNSYERIAMAMAQRRAPTLLVYALLVAVLAFGFLRLPTGFLPDEDQGVMFTLINTPAGATSERTLESVKHVENYFLTQQRQTVEHLFTVVGFSFAGSAQNAAMGFVLLKDWQQRPDPSQSVFSLAGQSMGAFSQIKDAFAFAFYPPPIISLGNASGFDFQLVDRAKVGHAALMQARNQVLAQAAQNPKLMGVRPNGLSDVSQFNINIDSERAAAMGLALGDINQTLQIAWGSSYVNDYLDQGAIKRVYIQAEAPYRMSGQDLRRWYVRNQEQKMVPFDAFSSAQWSYGSPRLERFNGQASVNIQGAPAPGVSTGAAMQAIEQIVAQIGNGVGLEWSGLSYEERQSGAQAPMLYALSLLIVFLALAALYESWIVPAAVLLVAPLGILGAVVASNVFGLNNDVYFQVALLTTVGLVSKNAILIIEFARNQKQQGQALMQAVALAARQRFRPILMTSFAFVLGVTPLALASGAGAASQNAIGIAVIGGMFAATFLAIFFVPMFYVGIEKLFDRGTKTAQAVSD